MPKITKTKVDAAKPDSKRYMVWDSELKGFGLQVLPSGVKSYVYNYRNRYGDSRRATIGKHGHWTAEEARRKAEEYRDSLKQGIDPLGERQAAKEAMTVAEALDAYTKSERFKQLADLTQKYDKARIERHLKPTLGKIRLEELSEEDVRRAWRSIRDGKTASVQKTGPRGKSIVRGGEGAARMAIRTLSVALNWIISQRQVANFKENPCRYIKLGTSGVRTTILEDANSYKRLFRALDKMEARKLVRQPVADAIRLIALTGCRRGEAAGLRWQHVRLSEGKLVLPPSSHKTGQRTGEAREIHLPALAQSIIARQPEGEPDNFVFAPAHGEGPISLSKPWRSVRKVALLPKDLGLHGLRHSIGSHMAMEGAGAAEIMQALGHTKLETSQRYIHWAEKQQRALAERAAGTALAGLAASTGKAAEVTPISKRGRG